ncbi:MAG: Ger(x)C family spore germination protein [Methylocystaceae bacterium]
MKHSPLAIRLLFILTLFLLPLSGGCWNQVEVNNAAVATGLGYDLAPHKQVKFSVQVIAPQSTGSGESGGGAAAKPFLTFSSTYNTPTNASRRLSLSVPRTMLWAHAAVYVLGDKMAREGMPLINDYLDRNRNIRKSGILVVAKDTEAQQVLQAESPIAQNPMFDLVNMIKLQDSYLGIYTPVLLAEYLNCLATPGIDPILLSVEVVEKEKKKQLRLSGMAVFKNDKLAGYLTERESQGYRWLRRHPSIQGGLLTIESPINNSPVLFEVLRATNSIKPVVKNGQITFKIKIQEDGNFYEEPDTNELLTPALIKSMEARVATKIENEARSYLNRSQQLGCDCVGFGREISQQNPNLWDQVKDQWPQIYPQVKFEFDVKAKIRRTGLTNNIIKVKS